MIDRTGLQRLDADLLGPLVGNEPPDLSSIPGIKRDDLIVFEYGSPETAFRIASDGCGYKFEIRDKGRIRPLAWFNCLADAERYVLVREGEVRNDAPWFDGKATTPAGVDTIEENSDIELRWHIDGAEHIVRTLSDIEWSLVYRLAWVRERSLAEVIEIVSGSSPGKQVGSI